MGLVCYPLTWRPSPWAESLDKRLHTHLLHLLLAARDRLLEFGALSKHLIRLQLDLFHGLFHLVVHRLVPNQLALRAPQNRYTTELKSPQNLRATSVTSKRDCLLVAPLSEFDD